MTMIRDFDPRLYNDSFISPECAKAFRVYNGSRVGQSATEWNEIKRIFEAGWKAAKVTGLKEES